MNPSERHEVWEDGQYVTFAISSAKAVECARQRAKETGNDCQVFKLVETHYIKAPVMPEPEVIDHGVVE